MVSSRTSKESSIRSIDLHHFVRRQFDYSRRPRLFFASPRYVEGSNRFLFNSLKALEDFQCQRAELMNTLAVQDCLHSYLEEHVAEPKDFSAKRLEIDGILNDVSRCRSVLHSDDPVVQMADFIPPTIDHNHEPRQGQYRPKGRSNLHVD